MNRLPPNSLAFWLAHLECSDCNETCWRGKMGPPESVQTFFIWFTQLLEIFYYWFILPQYSSVCPTNFLTFFCLGLQQIRDHFYYINGGHLYSKSGLGFAVTLSIKKLENLRVTRGDSLPIPPYPSHVPSRTSFMIDVISLRIAYHW